MFTLTVTLQETLVTQTHAHATETSLKDTKRYILGYCTVI